MKKLLLSLFCLVSLYTYAKADASTDAPQLPKLAWNLPLGIGTVQLPFQSSELVGGYDFILKDTIAGYSTPVCKLWNEIEGQVGMVGAVKVDAVEPYLGVGVDVAKHLPQLQDFTTLHVNAFGRYDTAVGKLGAGISASYSF